MTLETLIKNAFLDDLGTDYVAVTANGTPIARASDEASVRRAAPDAAHYLNADMLAKHVDGIDDIATVEAAPEPDPVAAGLDAVAAQSGTPATDADLANPNVSAKADKDLDDKAAKSAVKKPATAKK